MDFLKMLKPETAQQLVMNWEENKHLKGTTNEKRYKPICKLFNPCGPGTWLLTELEPNSSLAFGLCDLGLGTPEMGYVCLDELYSLRLPAGLKIEQDIYFEADKTLGQYADEARKQGYIAA